MWICEVNVRSYLLESLSARGDQMRRAASRAIKSARCFHSQACFGCSVESLARGALAIGITVWVLHLTCPRDRYSWTSSLLMIVGFAGLALLFRLHDAWRLAVKTLLTILTGWFCFAFALPLRVTDGNYLLDASAPDLVFGLNLGWVVASSSLQLLKITSIRACRLQFSLQRLHLVVFGFAVAFGGPIAVRSHLPYAPSDVSFMVSALLTIAGCTFGIGALLGSPLHWTLTAILASSPLFSMILTRRLLQPY